MGYKAENKRTIDYAFKRLMLNEQNVVRSGMIDLAKEALAYVANAHEIYDAADAGGHGGAEMEIHIQSSNVMAVAVGHDGHLEFSMPYEGGWTDEGRAEELAQQFAIRGSKGCWIAVIVSDMQGSIGVAYKESKEEKYFDYSKQMLGNYAIHNFKPVRR